MNVNDLINALQFLGVTRNGLVIQCPRVADVPYLKRTITSMLGQPSKAIGHTLYYGDRRIAFLPLTAGMDATRAFPEEELFYVGWEDTRADHIRLVYEDNIDISLDQYIAVPLWKTLGMSALEMHKAILSDSNLEEYI